MFYLLLACTHNPAKPAGPARDCTTEIPYDGIDNDCDPTTLDDDLDGDGVMLADDCNDGDAAVHPGAVEIWYDGIDEACDGGDDDDQDGDGDAATAAGGTDCDDTDPAVHSGAVEDCDTRGDDDCDGSTDEIGRAHV